MRPRSLGARLGIRWRIFHGRSNDTDLLPSGLSSETSPFGECCVLWFGSRRGTGRLPAMPPLPLGFAACGGSTTHFRATYGRPPSSFRGQSSDVGPPDRTERFLRENA